MVVRLERKRMCRHGRIDFLKCAFNSLIDLRVSHQLTFSFCVFLDDDEIRFTQRTRQEQVDDHSGSVKMETSSLSIYLCASVDELWDAMFYCTLCHSQECDNCECCVCVRSLRPRNRDDPLRDNWDNHIGLGWLWVACRFLSRYFPCSSSVNCSNSMLLLLSVKMSMLERRVEMEYEKGMRLRIGWELRMVVEQHLDRVGEIHADKSQRNGDQRRENHCNALAVRDDGHAKDTDHCPYWRRAVAEVLVLVVHCDDWEWEVFGWQQTMNDDDEYQAMHSVTMALLVLLPCFLLNAHYHSTRYAHNGQYVPMMKWARHCDGDGDDDWDCSLMMNDTSVGSLSWVFSKHRNLFSVVTKVDWSIGWMRLLWSH